MTSETRLTLSRDEDYGEAILGVVRGKWSSDFVIGETVSRNRYETEVRIDAHTVDLIHDAATGGRVFVRQVVPNVARFVVKTSPKKWLVTGSTAHEAFENLKKGKTKVVTKSERALLKAAHTELLQIDLVKMALSPIRGILVYLDAYETLSIAELRKTRKSQTQIDRYVSLLQQIGYVQRENGNLVPGSAFPRGSSDRDPTEIYDEMLAQVMEGSYQYLQQVLKLTQMVGPLRWSNSYYLTAFCAQEKVNLPFSEWQRRHDGYYPFGRRTDLETISQQQRVLDSGIVVKRDSGIEGDQAIYERFYRLAKDQVTLPGA